MIYRLTYEGMYHREDNQVGEKAIEGDTSCQKTPQNMEIGSISERGMHTVYQKARVLAEVASPNMQAARAGAGVIREDTVNAPTDPIMTVKNEESRRSKAADTRHVESKSGI